MSETIPENVAWLEQSLPLVRKGGRMLMGKFLRRSVRCAGLGPRMWADAAVCSLVDVVSWRWAGLPMQVLLRRTAGRAGGCGVGLLGVSGVMALGFVSAPLSAAVLVAGYGLGEGVAIKVFLAAEGYTRKRVLEPR